jgi:Uma2 family endonuclease
MATTTKIGFVSLESGDRLTRAEFHRRYSLRPDIKRAELIDGVVYVPSPTRFTLHDEQATAMVMWVATYAARHPDVRSGSSATLFLAGDNEVQPDAFLFKSDPAGPGARIDRDGYIDGAPRLVVEVAASSVSYDLHDKMEVYRRNGVQEYIVWRVLDEAIDWFRLREGQYVRAEPDARGVIESDVFPGLRLNVPKMLAGDHAGVLAELEVERTDA